MEGMEDGVGRLSEMKRKLVSGRQEKQQHGAPQQQRPFEVPGQKHEGQHGDEASSMPLWLMWAAL